MQHSPLIRSPRRRRRRRRIPFLPMPPPSSSPPSLDELKRIAAHRAVDEIRSGMIVGLGTGSTASHALLRLSDLLRRGLLRDIIGIPTSVQTERLARSLSIPLSTLDSHPLLDLSIDGADEVDPHLNLVKGRGGSLLREKMVEGASKRFLVIVDETKLVDSVGGSGLAVPVEVIPFCCKFTMGRLRSLFDDVPGFRDLRLRTAAAGDDDHDHDDAEPAVTDNLNYVVDLFFDKGIAARDLGEISERILNIVGVVEHGMFLGMASQVIVARMDGGVTVIDRMPAEAEFDA